MHRRLQQFVALWFVMQIVLPFTAPLQTIDFHDLFDGSSHDVSTTPESSTTPTITSSEDSMAVAAVPCLTFAPSYAFGIAINVEAPVLRWPVDRAFGLPATPHVQRSVLRL